MGSKLTLRNRLPESSVTFVVACWIARRDRPILCLTLWKEFGLHRCEVFCLCLTAVRIPIEIWEPFVVLLVQEFLPGFYPSFSFLS
jgi:hypothetical protein